MIMNEFQIIYMYINILLYHPLVFRNLKLIGSRKLQQFTSSPPLMQTKSKLIWKGKETESSCFIFMEHIETFWVFIFYIFGGSGEGGGVCCRLFFSPLKNHAYLSFI